MPTKKNKNISKKLFKKHKSDDLELATHNNEETEALLEKLNGGPLTFGEMIGAIRQCDEISQTQRSADCEDIGQGRWARMRASNCGQRHWL